MILHGRDLPEDNWREILTNPSTAAELEAFADYVFYLRHRKTTVEKIAKMLKTNESEVRSALASRGTP